MLSMLDDLKRAKPAKRQQLLQDMQLKNYRYLKRINPDLAAFILQRGTGRFGIEITDDFLNVIDRNTRQCFHPPGQLYSYMHELGAWHHSGWVDRMNIAPTWRGNTEHGRLVLKMVNGLYQEVPRLQGRLQGGIAKLPITKGRQRYSGPVVFLGIFTGLHIISYLSKTSVRGVFLIEPDLDRFALSCFFLDYEQMEQDYGQLMLHVGPNAPQYPIERLVAHAPVSASTWVRLLPAYPAGEFDDIINRVGLRWRSLTEIFVPYDRELQNLKNGMRNINDKRLFPKAPPELSPKSVIAVVASGPSLNQDMKWLKRNQKRLIIFASISCVRVLKENGIRVDFQCTLDTELEEPLFEQLQLDTKVPLLAYFKLDPKIVTRFEKVYLVYEEGKANPVRFLNSLTHTHPTTGNFMTAFAAWCKPSTLLFIGLDLGFREAGRSHVEGGWHDEDEGVGHVAETAHAEHLAVEANFAESDGQILTMSYYNNARFAIQDALSLLLSGGSKIYNLADGARISGAQAIRSAQLRLPVYPLMGGDLQAITNSFCNDYTGIMERYETPGEKMLQEMLEVFHEVFGKSNKFEWKSFSQSADLIWSLAVQRCLNKYKDMRVEIYGKLVADMLSEWYRVLLLTKTAEEEQKIFEKGKQVFNDVFAELAWPDELDSKSQAKKENATRAKRKDLTEMKRQP